MIEYTRVVCKEDYAENVNSNTPLLYLMVSSRIALYVYINGLNACFMAMRALDNSCTKGIITLTIMLKAITGDYYAGLHGSKSWPVGGKMAR